MLIERTCYLPKPDRQAEVLRARREACRVRVGIGLPAGDIWTGTTARGAMVFWDGRFADAQRHAADLAARAASPAFEAVRARMRTLIDDFDRQVLEPDTEDAASVLRDTPLDGWPIVPREMAFTSGELELKGHLYLPPGAGPFPCLVTNHGSGIAQGTTDACRPGVAALLMSWGIASFLPHRRGYGSSPGTPWRTDVTGDQGTEAYDVSLARRLDAESLDVLAALRLVRTLPEIDAAHVGVMGSSFGGTVTLLAAAREPSFRCAVEFAGAAMNWDRTPRLRELMLDAARRLTQPIFFIQAANDYSIRPTVELAQALAGSKLEVRSKVYPAFGLTRDEGHLLYLQGPAYWGADVRSFLEAWL